MYDLSASTQSPAWYSFLPLETPFKIPGYTPAASYCNYAKLALIIKYTGCIVNDGVGRVIDFGATYTDDCNTWYVIHQSS